MIKLVEKDIKIAFINIFYMLKKVKERMSTLRRKMEDIFYKTQTEFL